MIVIVIGYVYERCVDFLRLFLFAGARGRRETIWWIWWAGSQLSIPRRKDQVTRPAY